MNVLSMSNRFRNILSAAESTGEHDRVRQGNRWIVYVYARTSVCVCVCVCVCVYVCLLMSVSVFAVGL